MKIFDIIAKEGKQYLKDAMPGGLLNRELDYAGLRKAGEVASMIPTPLGDVASGLLAMDDLRNRQYGSAALNSIGLLPFVPGMAGVTSKWVRPTLESVGGDRALLEKASAQFNKQRADALVEMLGKHGIKTSGTGVLAEGKYTPWQNAIGGQSLYMDVPGYGTVRFSDHAAKHTNTFDTPEEALAAIKAKYEERIALSEKMDSARQMLGLKDEGGKANLARIQEWLKANPQTGSKKDPGYWAKEAGLDITKPGGWSFNYLNNKNPFK